MAEKRRSAKLAVILHADIAGSTALVHEDEHAAHERIQDAFHRFGEVIARYHGQVRELRGDALLAEFGRASDAVSAATAFQAEQVTHNEKLDGTIRPEVRIGIAMGEVIVSDNTVTGGGVVLAQRVEQVAEPGGISITSAIHEALPQRMPFVQTTLGEIADKTEEVVFYWCVPGNHCTPLRALAKAVAWGYQKVYYFDGGVPAWKEAGYPIETGE